MRCDDDFIIDMYSSYYDVPKSAITISQHPINDETVVMVHGSFTGYFDPHSELFIDYSLYRNGEIETIYVDGFYKSNREHIIELISSVYEGNTPRHWPMGYINKNPESIDMIKQDYPLIENMTVSSLEEILTREYTRRGNHGEFRIHYLDDNPTYQEAIKNENERNFQAYIRPHCYFA